MKTIVLDYLMKFPHEGKTTTQIGLALGKTYEQASVTGALKSLLKEGKIMRYKDDKKVKYRVKI